MENGILADFFEEPLAVKSFSTEEVYSTISKIAEKINITDLIILGSHAEKAGERKRFNL